MPGDNSQSNNQSQTSTNSEANGSNVNKGSSNEGSQEQNKQEQEKSIPYSRFAEVNSKFKETKDELAKYQAKEKEENERKLLEDKKFQELIGTKDERIKALESENNQIRINAKTESLKTKISSALAKNNIIDAEDGLKFVKYDDLLDSDAAEDEINKRVTDLVKSKAYLFKAGTQRSNSENNVPGNQQKSNDQGQKGKSTHQTIEQSLAEKLRF